MSPSRRQIRRVLLRAGLQSAPAPRPGFLAGLSARLAAQAERQLRPLLVALPGRRRPRFPVLAAGLALASAAVLVGALAGWFGRGESRQLALAAAVDTTVVLPDGTSVAGRVGLALPDGTLVRSGPNGRFAAGDVEVGPALEARVDAGQLRVKPSEAAAVSGAAPAVEASSAAPASGSASPVPTPADHRPALEVLEELPVDLAAKGGDLAGLDGSSALRNR